MRDIFRSIITIINNFFPVRRQVVNFTIKFETVNNSKELYGRRWNLRATLKSMGSIFKSNFASKSNKPHCSVWITLIWPTFVDSWKQFLRLHLTFDDRLNCCIQHAHRIIILFAFSIHSSRAPSNPSNISYLDATFFYDLDRAFLGLFLRRYGLAQEIRVSFKRRRQNHKYKSYGFVF